MVIQPSKGREGEDPGRFKEGVVKNDGKMFLISKINRKVLQPFELNSKMNIDLKRMEVPGGRTGSP